MYEATGSLYAGSVLKIFLHILSVLRQVGAEGIELFLPVTYYIESSCITYLLKKSNDVGYCVRLLYL